MPKFLSFAKRKNSAEKIDYGFFAARFVFMFDKGIKKFFKKLFHSIIDQEMTFNQIADIINTK